MPIERLWLFAKLYWRKDVAGIEDLSNKPAMRKLIEKSIKKVPQEFLHDYVQKCKQRM